MVNIAKITYRAYVILSDGQQINITNALTSLGWEENENEISTRINAKVANVTFNGQPLSSTVTPNTILVIMADAGNGEKEVARGYVTEWNQSRKSGGASFDVTAYDELYNLQQSQDDRYITAGTGTKSAISSVFSDWGIPVGEYKGPDKPHAKTVYKAQYLSDILLGLLDDAEKHGADQYIIRAQAGKVYILPVGSNEDVYHFSEDSNAISTDDRISTSGLVTRVKVMGLADDDEKRSPEAVVDGLTEYGIRQRLYNRSSDDTLETAKEAAQTIIDEEGQPERIPTLVSPDVPFVRKGDMIHAGTTALNGYFLIKSIEHDAMNRTMTMIIKPTEQQTTAEAAGTEAEEEKKTDFAVGDIVQFNGGSHYGSSTATRPASTGLGAGPAKITYTNPGAAHPWCLVTQDWSQTHVWGWVDDGTFS